MSLKETAKETLAIIESGRFINSAGKEINFLKEQQAAVEQTKLYRPEQGLELLQQKRSEGGAAPQIEVTNESTQKAARRLVIEAGCSDLVLLNFASARNPGGGFLNGAKAQEEDLTRCSGLYPTLLTQMEYYEYNRQRKTLLYSNYMIYSPNVPWFRTRSRDQPEELFLASVITAPAPNAGQHLRRVTEGHKEIEEALRQRAGVVLAVARDNGCRNLLLGAWGCGVFQNNPTMVADAFGQWLESPEFAGDFDRVVFAVYGGRTQNTLEAFQQRFQ